MVSLNVCVFGGVHCTDVLSLDCSEFVLSNVSYVGIIVGAPWSQEL